MNVQEVRAMAKKIGIKTSGLNKMSLIHSIQLAEGNFNCFSSAMNEDCDQSECVWRDDCFKAAKKFNS